MFPKWSDWNIAYTRKGHRKRQLHRTVKVLGLILSVYALYHLRHDFGGGMGRFIDWMRGMLGRGLHRVLETMDRWVLGRLVG